MDINAEELAKIVTAAVKAALAEERLNFRVPEKQHFLDHEQMHQWTDSMGSWNADHAFIKPIRESVDEVKKSAFKSVVKLLGVLFAVGCALALGKLKGWL